jgi:hypothetical protein
LRGLSQRVQLYTGAQINSGDLTPYLTYGFWAGGEKQRGLLNSVSVSSLKRWTGGNVVYVFDAISFAGFLTTAPAGVHPTATVHTPTYSLGSSLLTQKGKPTSLCRLAVEGSQFR